MPKKKRPEETPEKQFERYMETARKLGADETGQALERAFKKLKPTSIKSKPKPKPCGQS